MDPHDATGFRPPREPSVLVADAHGRTEELAPIAEVTRNCIATRVFGMMSPAGVARQYRNVVVPTDGLPGTSTTSVRARCRFG
jgi:hypothetical protein